MNDRKFPLSQEAIAITASAIAIVTTVVLAAGYLDGRIDHLGSELRAEMRADRETLRAEMRAEREANLSAVQALRESVEASARADREQFTREILRLTENQARLAATVDRVGG